MSPNSHQDCMVWFNNLKNSKLLANVGRVLLFILIIAFSLYMVSIKDQIRHLAGFGYPGIFLISLVSSASLFIPVPGVIVASTMGAILNPIGVAVAAGLGAAIGELSGYLAGFSGQAVIENVRMYEQMTVLMKKYGDVMVFILAFIPNPLFDMAGIISGMLKLPIWRFFIWCLLGKILKMLMFAYGGSFLEGLFAF
ncbi:MAG: VTT domain-containing protein [Anaerolineae bacterium]|nr:VTT domain-containing protein [Anaerolineae bacterium]